MSKDCNKPQQHLENFYESKGRRETKKGEREQYGSVNITDGPLRARIV